jgi:hypothetical protein
MRRGLSLVEIIVATGLLAVGIPLLLNLLPTSFLSVRKSEVIQQATSMAIYRLDEVPFLTPRAGVDLNEVQRVGLRDFRVIREFYQLDSYRWDVVIQCSCEDLTPVRLATRIIKGDS